MAEPLFSTLHLVIDACVLVYIGQHFEMPFIKKSYPQSIFVIYRKNAVVYFSDINMLAIQYLLKNIRSAIVNLSV